MSNDIKQDDKTIEQIKGWKEKAELFDTISNWETIETLHAKAEAFDRILKWISGSPDFQIEAWGEKCDKTVIQLLTELSERRKDSERFKVTESMICPIRGGRCDDEVCAVGTYCNIYCGILAGACEVQPDEAEAQERNYAQELSSICNELAESILDAPDLEIIAEGGDAERVRQILFKACARKWFEALPPIVNGQQPDSRQCPSCDSLINKQNFILHYPHRKTESEAEVKTCDYCDRNEGYWIQNLVGKFVECPRGHRKQVAYPTDEATEKWFAGLRRGQMLILCGCGFKMVNPDLYFVAPDIVQDWIQNHFKCQFKLDSEKLLEI